MNEEMIEPNSIVVFLISKLISNDKCIKMCTVNEMLRDLKTLRCQ